MKDPTELDSKELFSGFFRNEQTIHQSKNDFTLFSNLRDSKREFDSHSIALKETNLNYQLKIEKLKNLIRQSVIKSYDLNQSSSFSIDE